MQSGGHSKRERLADASPHRLEAFRRDSRGSVAVTAMILTPVLLIGLAGAIALAQLASDRSALQDRLDAAVLAGAGDPGDDAARIGVAGAYFNGNDQKRATVDGASATFTVQGDILSGVAEAQGSAPLQGILSQRFFTVHVTAAARRQGIPVCILGLDTVDSGAFDVRGAPSLNAPACAVQIDSSSSRGITQEGVATQHAAWFGVTGGADVRAFSPQPTAAAPAMADPLAQTQFPPHDPCAGSEPGLDVSSDRTLSPGTYCGGIRVVGHGTHVSFQPGVYVLVNGPLSIGGNASASGDEVLLAFTGAGATLDLSGSVAVTLTSPTAGPYANIQFFQDRGVAGGGASPSVGGSSRLTYDGIAYFPTQDFVASGNADIEANSPSLAVVAAKVRLQGSPTLNVTTANPRRVAAVGLVRTAYGAELIR
jgi:Flp pilus assembly protein TadG